MNLKRIAIRQYRECVNIAQVKLGNLQTPPEGWLRTMRKALGMSGAQLARRANVSRALISKTELAEASGRVTLKTMQSMAQAMNARFVYAIIPEDDVDKIIRHRAIEKAQALVNEASVHMALEAQTLSEKHTSDQIESLVRTFMENQPSSLWDDV